MLNETLQQTIYSSFEKCVQYSMQKLSSFLKCNTSITKYVHYIQGIKKLVRLLSLSNLAHGTDRTHTSAKDVVDIPMDVQI